jgi:sialate O-acetylesterase
MAAVQTAGAALRAAVAAVAAAVLLATTPAAALRFELSNTLGSGMVLQRAPAEPVVWGFSDPGQPVYAAFKDMVSNDTWTVQSTTDPTGVWRLPLPARPADNHSYELVVSTDPAPALYKWDGAVLLLQDLVYGDVLFFSGQSNMQGACVVYRCN